MPAERCFDSRVSQAAASGRKKKASSAKKVQVSKPCHICGKVVSRASDLKRHLKTHDPSKKLPCPWEGCDYGAHQKSNLKTHYRRHTQDKSQICRDDPLNCDFRTCDEGSLNRHRKRIHNYMPRSRCAPLPFPFELFTPNFSPFGETSSSLSMPLQPPSFHCSQPWNIPEPQMNGSKSHGWSPLAAEPSPTPSHWNTGPEAWQHFNYAEFQYSHPTENFPSCGGNSGYMPAPSPPTYLPFPGFNHSGFAGQSSDQSHWQSQPNPSQHWQYQDFGSLQDPYYY